MQRWEERSTGAALRRAPVSAPAAGFFPGISVAARRVTSDVRTAWEISPRCRCRTSHRSDLVVFQVLPRNARMQERQQGLCAQPLGVGWRPVTCRSGADPSAAGWVHRAYGCIELPLLRQILQPEWNVELPLSEAWAYWGLWSHRGVEQPAPCAAPPECNGKRWLSRKTRSLWLKYKMHVLQPRNLSKMSAKDWRKCTFLVSSWASIVYMVLSCFLKEDCKSQECFSICILGFSFNNTHENMNIKDKQMKRSFHHFKFADSYLQAETSLHFCLNMLFL